MQLDQDLGVSIPLRPLLRSNAWMREPRLRSEPISERTSSTKRRWRRRSAPLLYLACLIGGHSNWAGGHQPAQRGGRLASLVSLQLPPFHPASGRNNAHLRFLEPAPEEERPLL